MTDDTDFANTDVLRKIRHDLAWGADVVETFDVVGGDATLTPNGRDKVGVRLTIVADESARAAAARGTGVAQNTTVVFAIEVDAPVVLGTSEDGRAWGLLSDFPMTAAKGARAAVMECWERARTFVAANRDAMLAVEGHVAAVKIASSRETERDLARRLHAAITDRQKAEAVLSSVLSEDPRQERSSSPSP